jgi:catechol 2,3-dioxygenase-like lactoylglutathione lyase family enzyme
LTEADRTAVQLNHTAIYAADRQESAAFLAGVLGLEVGAPFGPFLPVDLGNGVTLDYYSLSPRTVWVRDTAGIPRTASSTAGSCGWAAMWPPRKDSSQAPS